MIRGPKSRSPGTQYLYDRYIGDDPEMVAAYHAARSNADVAMRLYHMRKKAGLTQRALAELVKTTPSVISRLEDADYDGHSLAMLKRIATALGQDVQVRFKPSTGTVKSGTKAALKAPPKRAVPTKAAPKKAVPKKAAPKKASRSESAPAKSAKKSRA